jgi:hypothetical protein
MGMVGRACRRIRGVPFTGWAIACAAALCGTALPGAVGCAEAEQREPETGPLAGGNYSGSVTSKLEFAQFLASEVCAWTAECSRQGLNSTPPCEAMLLESFMTNDSEAIVLDTARVDACVAAMRAAPDCLSFREAALAHCENILRGTLRVGSPCAHGDECEPGAHCDLTECPGECILNDPEQPLLQLGAPCDPPIERCEMSLTCDPVTLTCRNFRDAYRMSAVNEPCSEQEHCELELYCDQRNSICSALPGPGQACEAGYCQDGYYCDITAEPQVCTARLPQGATCEIGYPCATGSCQMGVCGEVGLLGSSCSADNECFSFYCGEGVCAKEPQCYGRTPSSEPGGTLTTVAPVSTVASVSTAAPVSTGAPLGSTTAMVGAGSTPP